jgi:DNA-binding winged helix-turn-helix (wHTH) protein
MSGFLVFSPQFLLSCGMDGSVCARKPRPADRTIRADVLSHRPDGLIFIAFSGMEVLGWASELKNSPELFGLPIAIIGKTEELAGTSENDLNSCTRFVARLDALTAQRKNRPSMPKRVIVDQRSRQIVVDGLRKTCSPAEFRMLLLFLRYPDIVFSREALLDHTRAAERNVASNLVNVLVSRIRHKLEPHPGEPANVRTVRGLGYVFERNSDRFIDALTEQPFVHWPQSWW